MVDAKDTMPEPTNLQEYLHRFDANVRTFGVGVETSQSMPCPFCAAAGWLVYRILETKPVTSAGATCSECGRSARAEYTEQPGGAIRFEFAQTGGPDQPDWLNPKTRDARVAAE